MTYRSSTGDLGFHDDPPARGGGGQRWDRDRFESMRSGGGGGSGGGSMAGGSRRGPPPREVDDHFRFQEHDRFPGGRRDIDVHEDYQRRGPRVAERERFREEEDLGRPSRRRTDFLDGPSPFDVANQALAPYRRKSIVDDRLEITPARRPQRPGYIRRQSSLDTFDRRPVPRYGEIERIDRLEMEREKLREREREREQWRPPANVEIPLPIRRRRSPSRRGDFEEEDFEEVRYREVEREPRREKEEYREVEVKREKSKVRRSHSRAARSVARSVRSASSSSSEAETVRSVTVGRRGKTRMPKRLVKKQAVIELGYPFEEEDDFIVVKRALEKEHIDEIIKLSENYKEEKTTYVYEQEEEIIEVAAPPPPPPPPAPVEYFAAPPPPPAEFYAPPPPASVIHSVHSHHTTAPPPPQVHYTQSVRTVSPSRHGHEIYEERIEQSNHISGPLTVLVPHEDRRMMTRSERDIKEEIRQLESERRMLKYEREGDYEVIERREPRREVIRVDKDRKVRKGPTPKLVAAMMATLT